MVPPVPVGVTYVGPASLRVVTLGPQYWMDRSAQPSGGTKMEVRGPWISRVEVELDMVSSFDIVWRS